LLGGGSLPEREWDHANGHKHKQVKGASKKMRFNGRVSLFFNGRFGIGSRIPESPKNLSEKTFPRISATGSKGNGETCQRYFQAIYKNKIERIPLNGLSRVAISAMIIGTIWFGIYLQPIFEALKR